MKWTPSTESNFVSFDVERGDDVTSFNEIAQVEGNGLSTQTYSFTDKNSPTGISYYRIRQTDNNGASIYTNTIPIMNKSSLLTASISPNPSNEFISVKCDEPYSKVSILTMVGKEVMELDESEKIDISSLAQGIYLVKLSNRSSVVATGRFIKN